MASFQKRKVFSLSIYQPNWGGKEAGKKTAAISLKATEKDPCEKKILKIIISLVSFVRGIEKNLPFGLLLDFSLFSSSPLLNSLASVLIKV